MKKIIAILLFVNLAWSAEKVNFKQVTELSVLEPFGAQLFHSDALWVGRSRKDRDLQYQVEAYASDGTLRGLVPLEHSAQFIYAYNENSVIVTGNTPYPTHTLYTIVSLTNGKLTKVQSKKWPMDVMVFHFARMNDGREFFGAPGGSLNQPPLEPGQPAPNGVPSILVTKGSGYTFLKPELRFLQQILAVGKYLFVYEGGPATGDETISRVEPTSQTVKRAFKFGQYYAMGFPVQLDASTVAAPVRSSNEILLIDVESMALKRSLPVAAGTPRCLAKLGKCVVAASQESKKVTFLKVETGEEVAVWDFGAAAGEALYGLKALSVDAASGNVYVRSGFPGKSNGVWMAKGENDEAFTACR